ncbi:CCAAT- binding transcription factor component [Dispira simplex]|nr:CCAAT- binding transcription factor component [Dispira simplex]
MVVHPPGSLASTLSAMVNESARRQHTNGSPLVHHHHQHSASPVPTRLGTTPDVLGTGTLPSNETSNLLMVPQDSSLTLIQRDTLQHFWNTQVELLNQGKPDFKTHALPLARIKKVMKTDENVRMISAEAPLLFSRACEIFITELTLRAWFNAEDSKRRTLQRSDASVAVSKFDQYDFLIDIVPREDVTKNFKKHREDPSTTVLSNSSIVVPSEQPLSHHQPSPAFNYYPPNMGQFTGTEAELDLHHATSSTTGNSPATGLYPPFPDTFAWPFATTSSALGTTVTAPTISTDVTNPTTALTPGVTHPAAQVGSLRGLDLGKHLTNPTNESATNGNDISQSITTLTDLLASVASSQSRKPLSTSHELLSSILSRPGASPADNILSELNLTHPELAKVFMNSTASALENLTQSMQHSRSLASSSVSDQNVNPNRVNDNDFARSSASTPYSQVPTTSSLVSTPSLLPSGLSRTPLGQLSKQHPIASENHPQIRKKPRTS